MPNRLLFFSFVFLFISSGQVHSHSPAYRWRTIQTEHFWVHYHQGEEHSAQHVACLAEELYPPITTSLHTDPGRVHVVLNGHTDFANGYATPLPKHIELYTTSPQGKWAGTRQEDWLRLLFAHEYTHIVQFSVADGFTLLGKLAFGDLALLSNCLIPGWAIEGIAVTAETIYSKGGRGTNPYFEMLIKAPLLEGRMWNLAQAGHPGEANPPLDRFYIAGYYLTDYLRRHHGDRTLAEIYREYSFFPFFGLGFSTWMATGHSSGAIYRDMLAELRGKFQVQRENVEHQGLTKSRRLTRQKAAFFHRPQWTNDGQALYTYLVSYDTLPALVKIDIATGRFRRLVTAGLTHSGSFNCWQNRTVHFAKLSSTLFSEDDIFSDLYSYDLKTGREKRLTRGLRAWSPSLSPDGKQLLCVKNEGVYNNLYLLSPDGTGPQRFTHLPGACFSNPVWSPDGKKIAVAVNIRGKQDIYLVNSDGSALRPLYGVDSAGEFDPVWSPDGRYLLFGSDRTGINNIYAFDLKTERLYQVTNVVSGAFEPAVSPDMKVLAFTQYSSEGFSVYVMDFAPEKWPEVKYQKRFVKEVAGLKPGIQYDSVPYSPWGQLLRPTFWLPVLGEDEKGIQLGGLTLTQDVLSQHSLLVELLAGVNSHRPNYFFSYGNHQSYPIIWAEVFDQSLREKGLFPDTLPDSLNEYWSREQGGGLHIGLPLSLRSNAWATSLFLRLGLIGKRVSRLSDIPVGYEGEAPRRGNYVGISGRLMFLNGYAAFKDILPIYAPLVTVAWETTNSSLGSDYRASELRATICQHLPLGDYIQTLAHHVLAVDFSLQFQQGDYRYEKWGFLPRGHDENASPFDCKNLALASVQYEFPIWYVDNGWGTLPLFLRRVTGDLFLDCGSGWRGPLNQQSGRDILNRAKTSWGAELKLHTFLFYRLPLWFGLGATYQPGKKQVILYPTLGLFARSSSGESSRNFPRKVARGLINQRFCQY